MSLCLQWLNWVRSPCSINMYNLDLLVALVMMKLGKHWENFSMDQSDYYVMLLILKTKNSCSVQPYLIQKKLIIISFFIEGKSYNFLSIMTEFHNLFANNECQSPITSKIYNIYKYSSQKLNSTIVKQDRKKCNSRFRTFY